jgi:flagellar assembly factor FliW
MTETISNTTIGEINFEEESLLHFKEGMLGLPNLKRYLLLLSDDLKPFYRLQCVDEPSISFLLLDSSLVDDKYRDYLQKVLNNASISEESCAIMFVINISEDSSVITANMAAPVILHHGNMEGFQTILIDSPYSVRYDLMQEEEKRKEA